MTWSALVLTTPCICLSQTRTMYTYASCALLCLVVRDVVNGEVT